MLSIRKFTIVLLSVFELSVGAAAQTDATTTHNKVANLQKEFNTQIKNAQGYMSGTLYAKQYSNYQNNQFYKSEQWQPCRLHHNTESYDHKFVRYDMYNDVLVVLIFTAEGSKFVQLNKEYISSFEMDNHHFEYKTFAQPMHKTIFPKYYEPLVVGRYSLYKSWQKSLTKPTESTYGHFDEFVRYIVEVDGKAYEVNNEKALLAVNEELAEFAKKNNLTFANYESDLIGMMEKLNKK